MCTALHYKRSAPIPSPNSALKSQAMIRMCFVHIVYFSMCLLDFVYFSMDVSRLWEVYTHQHDFLFVDVNLCCKCTLADVLCPLKFLAPLCVQHDSDAVFVFVSSSTHVNMISV